jgi:AcrR family transcriptional regulator
MPKQARGGSRPGAGRPRLDADSSILAAARTLLRTGGFRSLTVDEVARQANVSPGTVYRRWPTKTALALAAYSDTIGSEQPADTGSLRGDLDEFVPALHQFFAGDHGKLLASLAHATGMSEDIHRAIAAVTRRRRAGLRRILERAQQRRELRDDVDLEVAMDLMLGPLWTRLLVTGGRITTALVHRVVHLAADAIER